VKLSAYAAAALVLFSACSTEAIETPEQVVMNFFEAYENGDGCALADCMSADALTEINLYIERLRETPEESSVYLNSIGINLSAEELEDITAGDFVTTLFNSEAYSEQLPNFSDTEIGHALVYGDKAIVPVTTDNGQRDLELVFENQRWKITTSGMGFF